MIKLGFYLFDSRKLKAVDSARIQITQRIKEQIRMKQSLQELVQARFPIRDRLSFALRIPTLESTADILARIDDERFLYLDPITFKDIASQ